ncbi:MAG: hypothetical protein R3C99_18370 [Pirellulaceae bacterium]
MQMFPITGGEQATCWGHVLHPVVAAIGWYAVVGMYEAVGEHVLHPLPTL